jgi:hypothetical protein
MLLTAKEFMSKPDLQKIGREAYTEIMLHVTRDVIPIYLTKTSGLETMFAYNKNTGELSVRNMRIRKLKEDPDYNDSYYTKAYKLLKVIAH